MTMISKAAVGIAVGIAGIFVGYCFYFDQKRRSDPDFKKKLRERRKAKKQAQSSTSKIQDLKDHEVVQRFFLQEVQLGEEMLTCGDVEGGIEHLGNAVAVCGQPAQLLQVLQKTLPPQIFHLLLQRLQPISQKLSTQIAMAEEDVE
ncbi:mitochondrial import receptor subunit TOM20 homolog [Bombus vosnesenskii]|uniref:Mitochondrial import receptor subunit TOM20 homolog n=3 Tax=Pyrobombus TaxID=144703 RepID=A0A6J3KGC9_9HYME|nr:mitochondrial import receptor subunit TOM20 homolog [Bombus impatiens]XP_033195788.1 mitochondrial import receptor subunit TOM20 homolog [Bombus vancouverensis nearcticus]XP_033301895.1 mitochondrial import receptor subunit TOM20 homolog [Bombus bifarius]XP_033352193.1 mitochondrial import receptor subunit TOM20 homolog [Bombus vosnesenskii]XP_043593628.1 mitochondrial import receptor subunit TOM20 homolog [Bombus pyrosoma]XP_050480082.1 mitochondrial import receptor subunit TOM20 homolog [